jgi:Mn2+/Fe2+ NRAMP family transporter
MYLREPVTMVVISGVSQALMLPIIGFCTLYLRYVHLPKNLVPNRWITWALWVTSAIMLVMTGYSLARHITG